MTEYILNCQRVLLKRICIMEINKKGCAGGDWDRGEENRALDQRAEQQMQHRDQRGLGRREKNEVEGQESPTPRPLSGSQAQTSKSSRRL